MIFLILLISYKIQKIVASRSGKSSENSWATAMIVSVVRLTKSVEGSKAPISCINWHWFSLKRWSISLRQVFTAHSNNCVRRYSKFVKGESRGRARVTRVASSGGNSILCAVQKFCASLNIGSNPFSNNLLRIWVVNVIKLDAFTRFWSFFCNAWERVYVQEFWSSSAS